MTKTTPHFLLILLLVLLLAGCGSANDIFPSVPLSESDPDFELPNPVSIAVDVARGQIIVANSNVDFLFDHGLLGVFAVDASDPANVSLSASALIEIPNFAGEMVFDGTLATIPFREESASDETRDQIIQYTVGAGTASQTNAGTLAADPFGIVANGTDFLAVSDDILSFVAADLSTSAEVDLTVADTAGILEAKSAGAEAVAIDAVSGRAFVTNRSGKMFVVDLASKTVTHVLSDATSTRGILADSGLLYVLDGSPAQVWVLDPARLGAATSAPEEVTLSSLAIAQIAVGVNPNGLAIDAVNSRLFVSNTGSPGISVIDTRLLIEIARLSFKKEDTGLGSDGEEPFGLARGTYGGTSLLFVANLKTNNIYIFNALTLKLVGVFE